MPIPYHQLTIEERERIQAMLWEGRSLRAIAAALGRNPSTISRELHRSDPPHLRRYFPRHAHEEFRLRIARRGRRPRLKSALIRDYVEAKLPRGWSPEQIAGRLPRDHPGHTVSHEAIYQYVYARAPHEWSAPACDLRRYLRRHHKRRGRRRGLFRLRPPKIPHRIGIELRPVAVAARREQGHWEGDCMVSSKSLIALLTLEERASGFLRIQRVSSRRVEAVNAALVRAFATLPPTLRRTLTLDNGPENAGHEILTKETGVKCFFCRPYHSWEKGSIENTNGLVRWYLPKGIDFATVDEDRLLEIQQALNSRPRKRLGYRTPREVFKGRVLR